MEKRIIICCDGTWRDLKTEFPTNVVKISQAITHIGDNNVPQVIYYDEGIGTGYFRLLSAAFGWGMSTNIMDCYRFLSLNYSPGDEVYFFGFSRGAYTVRSLAGLIYNSGLPQRQHIRMIPRAYALYQNKKIHPDDEAAVNFRLQYGQRIKITFLGCWDTVGSLGVPDRIPFLPLDKWINKKYKFHDTKINFTISFALHAMAIDEHRKVFDVTPMRQTAGAIKSGKQVLKQMWFIGNHECVGGGDRQIQNLSDITLAWMMEETSRLGLKLTFNTNQIQTGMGKNPNTDFDNKIRFIFKLTGQKLRDISGNFADLHPTVQQRWQARADYRPKNLIRHQKQLDST